MKKTLCALWIAVALAGCAVGGASPTAPAESAEALSPSQVAGIEYALGRYLLYDMPSDSRTGDFAFDEASELPYDRLAAVFVNVLWMSYGTPGSYCYRYDPDADGFDLVDLSGATSFDEVETLPAVQDTLGLIGGHTVDEGLGRGVFVLSEDAARMAMTSLFGRDRLDAVNFFDKATSAAADMGWWYADGYFLLPGGRPYVVGGVVTPAGDDLAFEEGKVFTFRWSAGLNPAFGDSAGVFLTEAEVAVTLTPDADSAYGYHFRSFTARSIAD